MKPNNPYDTTEPENGGEKPDPSSVKPTTVEDNHSDWSSSDEGEQGDQTVGITDNQLRLLYLISLYTHGQNPDEKDSWIRKPAVMVLIYEAILAQLFEYDYGPASELVDGHRVFFNKSQEGLSDVDFLREEQYLNGLKMATKSYTPITCYQVSPKGLEAIATLKKADREPVHEFVYAPGTRELLYVEWEEDSYWLKTLNGTYKKKSTVTDIEEVSYVSSAYIPQCLRHGGRPTLSNAHRAHESGVGNHHDTIHRELDEVITLNSVSIIVAEYIPFGANQIVQMNSNLGCTERVQGGYFTSEVDTHTTGTKLEIQPGLTSIDILDYSLTKHINFEADIHLPVDKGITQIETLGVSMNASGGLYYGMQIEAVIDRIKDNISINHLSRLLTGVHIDSSQILDTVLSAWQRNLMDLIFVGDSSHRNKVNLIIANEITPHLTAEEYMDKSQYENCLKQVIGETRAAFDISEHDTLIFGENGFMVAGPNSRHHEPLLCAYLQFNAMDIFVRNYFNRMFLLLDDMNKTRNLLNSNSTSLSSLATINEQMASLCKQIIMMEEILEYMEESLEVMSVPAEPPAQAGRALYERLQISDMKSELKVRVKDLHKTLGGARHELDVLQQMANTIRQTKGFELQDVVNSNTRNLMDLEDNNNKIVLSLKFLIGQISGLFVFALLDHFIGPSWTSLNGYLESLDFLISDTPIWFLINILIFIIVMLLLLYLLRHYEKSISGTVTSNIRIMEKCDMSKLKEYIKSKDTRDIIRDYEGNGGTVRARWYENNKSDWGGTKPQITLEYDESNEFLSRASITFSSNKANKKSKFTCQEIKDKLFLELENKGIWKDKNKNNENKEEENIETKPTTVNDGSKTPGENKLKDEKKEVNNNNIVNVDNKNNPEIEKKPSTSAKVAPEPEKKEEVKESNVEELKNNEDNKVENT